MDTNWMQRFVDFNFYLGSHFLFVSYQYGMTLSPFAILRFPSMLELYPRGQACMLQSERTNANENQEGSEPAVFVFNFEG